MLRRALSDRSLTLLFIRLPDRPKRNQEGSAQLHGIVTTLSRLAHGWEPYLDHAGSRRRGSHSALHESSEYFALPAANDLSSLHMNTSACSSGYCICCRAARCNTWPCLALVPRVGTSLVERGFSIRRFRIGCVVLLRRGVVCWRGQWPFSYAGLLGTVLPGCPLLRRSHTFILWERSLEGLVGVV